MKKFAVIMRFTVLAVLAGAICVSGAKADSRRLVIYCPHPLAFIEPLVKEFESKTGIRTELVAAGTGELLKRIEAEAGNPLGDVIWGGSMSSLDPFRKYFETYHSPEEAAFFAEVKIPDGKITSFTLVPSVLMVNTQLIGGVRVEGYQDLLNPELKGKIAHGDPSRSSSAFEHLVNMLYALGKGDPEKGWDYVDKFCANLDGKLLSGSSAVYKGVADGEYAVGLTFEEGGAKYVAAKAPVKLVYMKEGVISKPDGTAIIKGAKNMENARKFVDFISSREVQSLIAGKLNRRSVRKDVTPGEGLLRFNEIFLIQDNAETVKNNKRVWLEKFRDIFANH